MADSSVPASIGLLKRIRGGIVRLGSRFHPREEKLRRNVFVPEFEMAHTPVTVSQYSAFLNSGAEGDRRWWGDEGWAWLNGGGDGWGRGDRRKPDGWSEQLPRGYHPVVGVTAFEAGAYCAWLSEAKQRRVRLPTEEEWERAARGDDGRPFPWGEEFDAALVNTVESDRRDSVPVASLPGDVSPFEVLDMGGNVQEWTASAYQPLPDEIYPPSPVLRVARGGSFNDTAFGARAPYRRAYPPGYFFPFLGFRIVVEHH